MLEFAWSVFYSIPGCRQSASSCLSEISSRLFDDALTNRISVLLCRNVRRGSSAKARDDANVEPTMSFSVTERNAEGKNTRCVSYPRKETKISVQDSERKAETGYGARCVPYTLHPPSLLYSFPSQETP